MFDLEVEREVRLCAASPDLTAVGFESRNRVTNTGAVAWRRETGLLSIWIAGTFAPGPATTIVLPLAPGGGAAAETAVNDRYFGRIPADRLVATERAVYYRADGQQRGKIGVAPRRARPALGSYDAGAGALAVVTYTLPADAAARPYVNSLWEHQIEPYAGDAVNAYNDGPAAPGAAPFGPFYELETSSPALALAPGESAEHLHRTCVFVGAPAELDAAARAWLGVGVTDVAWMFDGGLRGRG